MACRKDIEVVPKKKKTLTKKKTAREEEAMETQVMSHFVLGVQLQQKGSQMLESLPQRDITMLVLRTSSGGTKKKERLCSFTDRKVMNSKIGCPVNMTSLQMSPFKQDKGEKVKVAGCQHVIGMQLKKCLEIT